MTRRRGSAFIYLPNPTIGGRARGSTLARANGALLGLVVMGAAAPALGRLSDQVGMTRQGNLAEAQEQLEGALKLFGIDSMAVHRAHVLLLLATARHGRGDLPGARALLRRAQDLAKQLVDPGVLPALLEQTTRTLDSAAPRPTVELATPLTERELVVLRLVPTRLSTPEIGRELHVSVNTIRSQVQGIYRKLDVGSRAEAVAQARQLGLLPGSAQPRP